MVECRLSWLQAVEDLPAANKTGPAHTLGAELSPGQSCDPMQYRYAIDSLIKEGAYLKAVRLCAEAHKAAIFKHYAGAVAHHLDWLTAELWLYKACIPSGRSLVQRDWLCKHTKQGMKWCDVHL